MSKRDYEMHQSEMGRGNRYYFSKDGQEFGRASQRRDGSFDGYYRRRYMGQFASAQDAGDAARREHFG